jgi:hypothetical protein
MPVGRENPQPAFLRLFLNKFDKFHCRCVAQAKLYAQKLNLETTYSTNGNEIYQICLKTGEEKRVEDWFFPVTTNLYSAIGNFTNIAFTQDF